MLNSSEFAGVNASTEERVICEVLSDETVSCAGVEYHLETEGLYTPSKAYFWVYLCLYMFLVLFAGLMSGLTMGLLSLNKMSLEILKRGGQPNEKKFSKRILILVKKHHFLLVTLLLANALAVEAMPVFLSKITSEIVAIIVSVTAVLIFGEIVPQSLCTRFGLAIGYYCSPLVMLLMVAFFPIAFPMSLLLDLILGKGHGTFFRRAELKELVNIHGSLDHDDPLSYDEVLILKGALDMRYKTVKDAMTPLESVFMLNINGHIDGPTMKKLLEVGHSRVPVFQDKHGNVCGILLVKKLIQLDPLHSTPICTVEGANNTPPSCLTSTPLYDQLNRFQTGRSHLNIVYEEGEHATDLTLVGIITLEDVIEELIGEEIVDETDQYVDVHRRIEVARTRLAYMKHSASEPVPAKHRRNSNKRPTKFMTMISQPLPGESSSTNLAGTPGVLSSPDSCNPEHSKEQPVTKLQPSSSSGGELDLETIYQMATSTPREDSLVEDTAQDLDEREDAPLISS